jgi:restriction system protein
MPIPDYQSLMLPVLSASLDGEIRIGDVVERLAEKLSLTPEERSQLLPSGKQTVFANRVHWAKTYLGKAWLIESTRRGYFKITASGRQVVESKPARIGNNFLSQFEEFEKWRGSDQEVAAEQLSAAPAIVNQKETPDEIMRAAHRQIETALAQELLDRIRSAYVQLQQIPRRVAGTARRLRLNATKSRRRQVESIDESVDEPRRIISADVIVHCLRQQQKLRTFESENARR